MPPKDYESRVSTAEVVARGREAKKASSSLSIERELRRAIRREPKVQLFTSKRVVELMFHESAPGTGPYNVRLQNIRIARVTFFARKDFAHVRVAALPGHDLHHLIPILLHVVQRLPATTEIRGTIVGVRSTGPALSNDQKRDLSHDLLSAGYEFMPGKDDPHQISFLGITPRPQGA